MSYKASIHFSRLGVESFLNLECHISKAVTEIIIYESENEFKQKDAKQLFSLQFKTNSDNSYLMRTVDDSLYAEKAKDIDYLKGRSLLKAEMLPFFLKAQNIKEKDILKLIDDNKELEIELIEKKILETYF